MPDRVELASWPKYDCGDIMTDRPTKFAHRPGSSAVTSDSSRTEKLRAIREARESIEKDGTIPFEEIEAWVNSWGTPNELPPPQPRKR